MRRRDKVLNGHVPSSPLARDGAQVMLLQALLAEQQQTNQLLRELLERGPGGSDVPPQR